jgi:hypothetical protein
MSKKLVSKEYVGEQLLNPEFRYAPSAATNIKATFERVRRRLAAEEAEKNKKLHNVLTIKKEAR